MNNNKKLYHKLKIQEVLNYEYPYIKYFYEFKKDRFAELLEEFESIIIRTNTIPDNIPKIDRFEDKYVLIKENWEKNEELNNLTDVFTESCRVKCSFANKPKPIDYWNQNKELIIKNSLNKHNKIYIKNIRDYVYRKTKLCSNFRISVALGVLSIFKPKKWLDISAGWGDRLIAAIAYKNLDLYFGVDPNDCLFPLYQNIIDAMNVDPNKYTIVKDGFETAVLPDHKFDLVFSSPPFFDLEIYSQSESDSMRYSDQNIWYEEFLIKSLEKAMDRLEIGGHMVLYMGEGIKTHYIDKMIDHLTSLMKYKGAIYYYYPENIKKPRPLRVWQKVEIDDLLNPTIKIEPINVDVRTFNIFRDDYLIGGTKQRMLYAIMSKSKYSEFVYAGPYQGYAQIALSYVAKMLNKKATLFLDRIIPMWPLTKYAEKFDPNIMEIHNGHLKKLQSKAVEYSKQQDACLIPFGLHSPEYVDILADQISKVLPVSFDHPKRIWLVAGSATILNALYKVFPNAFFNVVQVGKKIWPDQMDESRTKLYISDQKFHERSHIQPPYPSVATYDAKLWKFVLEHGQDGDYIWNVGKDKN